MFVLPALRTKSRHCGCQLGSGGPLDQVAGPADWSVAICDSRRPFAIMRWQGFPDVQASQVQLPALPYAVTLFALRSRDEKVPLSDLRKSRNLIPDSPPAPEACDFPYLGVRHKIASVAQALSLLGCQRSRHFMLATGMEAAIGLTTRS